MRVTVSDNPRLEFLRDKTLKLTEKPGCYIMKNRAGTIIYIGKAKNLRNRVSSYFRDNDHLPKVAKMVTNVYDYDFIVTDSEYEALVLESSLIKQHQPKYNILLKDDKGYSYIKISDEPYPRITRAMQKKGDGTFIGPYTSGLTTKQTVEEVNRVFMLPTCKRVFPRDFGKQRPCLNFQIKRCIGLCRGCFSQEEYSALIGQAVDYIKSGSCLSCEELTEQMNIAAENMEFERAAMLRDRIAAIKRAAETQKIYDKNLPDTDVIALAQNGESACISVLIYRNGRLSDKADYLLGELEDENSMREDFLVQYYSQGDKIPKSILVDSKPTDSDSIARYLKDKSGHTVSISEPMRGDLLSLVKLAKSNAAEHLSMTVGRTGKEIQTLEDLATLIGLKTTPKYIECYDISNIGSADMVGGMVVLDNARPLKKNYRKFNIKTVYEQNDYASMNEVLCRRFSHYLDPNETDAAFKTLPDLIFLDGGTGHLSAVVPSLRGMGITCPIYGLVKDSKHRTRAVISESGEEISIIKNRAVFDMLTRLQDEVHRYTFSFQSKKHLASTMQSSLTAISGIGPKKAQALLMAFKTKESLKSATVEDIAAVMKISFDKADEVKRIFIDEIK